MRPGLITFLIVAGLFVSGTTRCSGGNDGGDAQSPAGEPVSETAVQPPPASPTSVPTPEPTPIPAASVPIIDLHFHPEEGWGDVSALFDQAGVRAGGNGASGPDSVALDLAQRYPGRVIAFGGGNDVRQLVLRHGSAAWNLENEDIIRVLAQLEEDLQAGRFKGIGEVHVNNWNSNVIGSPQYRYPADSPLLRRLLALAAAYDVPLSVHMDAEPESVAQMERLLASEPEGKLLWAHAGHIAEPGLVRRLLEEHPNLYCELSYRISLSVSRTAIPMDTGGRLKEEWRQLLEDFPDRFVIGTDLGAPSPAGYRSMIAFWRQVLEQLAPVTANRIAYLNAEALVRVQP